MSKASFLAAFHRQQAFKESHPRRAAPIACLRPFDLGEARSMPTMASSAKAAATVEEHELEPQPELELANCSLFTAYGVNPDLARWFKQNCASSAHLSTQHEICLDKDDDDSGPTCVICQDTTAGCFLYVALPCCQQVVGDECLLSCFVGGEISNVKGTRSRMLASTTCPCCRADLLPKPTVFHTSWEDEQEERALAAIMEESRAWITNRPPPPVADSSQRVKPEVKRKKRGILEALRLRRRASASRSPRTVEAHVLEGEITDENGLMG